MALIRVLPPRLLGALVAAGLLASAAEPLSWWWGGAGGIAVLVASLRGAGLRASAAVGLVAGVGWVLLLAPWLAAVGAAAWYAASLAVGVMVAGTSLVMAGVLRLTGWPVWAALAWVLGEALWSSWPLGGFPWPRLAWAVVDSPWEGWLPRIGVSGTSLIIALVGTCLAWLVVEGRRSGRRLAGGTALVAVAFLPLVWVPASLTPAWTSAAATSTVAVVQGGVPGDGTQVAAYGREVTDRLADATVALSARARRGEVPVPELVVWPENSTAVDPRSDAEVRLDLARASEAVDVPLLAGTVVDGSVPGTALNQTRVWRDGRDTGPIYTKRHLVPFGEYVPWRDQLEQWGIGRIDEVPRDMLPGGRQAPVEVAGVRLGVLICYDVAHTDTVTDAVRGGAQILVVQTSNATFAGTVQPDQQLAITRARALETGRSVVVAATTGVSTLIEPDGTVSARSADEGRAILLDDVAVVSGRTTASYVGPWVTPTSGAALVAAVGAWFVGRRRRRNRTALPTSVASTYASTTDSSVKENRALVHSEEVSGHQAIDVDEEARRDCAEAACPPQRDAHHAGAGRSGGGGDRRDDGGGGDA